jgi:hypothetical protein
LEISKLFLEISTFQNSHPIPYAPTNKTFQDTLFDNFYNQTGATMEKLEHAKVRYYSTATICKMLDVSRAWLWDQVNAGHFPKPIKLGRLARYKAEDVERFLANQEQIAEINLMGE